MNDLLQDLNQITENAFDRQTIQTEGIEKSSQSSCAAVDSKNDPDINFDFRSLNPLMTDDFSDYEPTVGHTTNIKEKPFVCNVCGKSFKYNSHYILHERTHTNEKPFACSACEMKFVSQSRLNKHMVNHSIERPFICDICNDSFKIKTSLRLHKRVHSTEKEFECNLCKKNFRSKSTLKRHHAGIHSDLRPHVCVKCGKGFKLKDGLKGHMMKVHTQKKYTCDLCNKEFIHRDIWVHHMQEHTGEKPHVCQSEEKFSSSDDLNSHTVKHMEERTCTKCKENYPIKYLSEHMKMCNGSEVNNTLTDSDVRCISDSEVCETQLLIPNTLETHKFTHLGRKLYTCGICRKGFDFLSSLRRHMKMHERRGL